MSTGTSTVIRGFPTPFLLPSGYWCAVELNKGEIQEKITMTDGPTTKKAHQPLLPVGGESHQTGSCIAITG